MKKRHFAIVTGAFAAVLTAFPLLLLGFLLYRANPSQDLHATDSGSLVQRPGTPELPEPSMIPANTATTPAVDAMEQQVVATNLPVLQSPSANTSASEKNSADLNSMPAASSEQPLAATSAPSPVVTDSDSSAQGHEHVRGDIDMDTAMADVPLPLNISGYQATGHMALVSQRKDEKPAAAKSKEKKTPEKKTQENKSEEPKPEGPDAQEPDLTQFEDVLIQTPDPDLEVAQVENLVATTNAKGWPIALVRSDIPEDVWWVQQVVGIRGKSFAARVNFGNRDSLSGSAYKLVIVFLDSEEEVRRFRIAKQFEEIPKGVRRSREFTYVRK
jgi:hypothetical protein